MSSAEFSLWIRYNDESPIGDERGDYQAGIIASAVANMSGRILSEGVYRTPSDFIPWLASEEPEEVQSDPDPIQFFTAQAALFDLQKGKPS